ncbi:hypothetical protein HDU78_003097 [Chytriomyces hyalinus]|nr:hypothetical protein HDU78_003097 [Chytriomyces hyalinus]KAJ3266561.1 hypothetical protein HDU77_000112 [Chytriomyces hyalinus]
MTYEYAPAAGANAVAPSYAAAAAAQAKCTYVSTPAGYVAPAPTNKNLYSGAQISGLSVMTASAAVLALFF